MSHLTTKETSANFQLYYLSPSKASMFVTTPPKKSLIHLKFQLPGTYFETPSVPVPSVALKIRISAILSPTLSVPMTNRPYFETLAYKKGSH